MGMNGVGNGKAASGGGGRNDQRGSVALGKTPVAKPTGGAGQDQARAQALGHSPVATPRSTTTMRSGDKVASPSGGGGTDQKNGLVARPGDGGTDAKQIERTAAGKRGGISPDPRDYLPDPSSVVPGNVGRAAK